MASRISSRFDSGSFDRTSRADFSSKLAIWSAAFSGVIGISSLLKSLSIWSRFFFSSTICCFKSALIFDRCFEAVAEIFFRALAVVSNVSSICFSGNANFVMIESVRVFGKSPKEASEFVIDGVAGVVFSKTGGGRNCDLLPVPLVGDLSPKSMDTNIIPTTTKKVSELPPMIARAPFPLKMVP